MGKGGNKLQNTNQEIKEPQESLDDLENEVINLYKKLETKNQFIEFLQMQLIKKEKETINATCETSDLIHLDDTTCDSNDLMEKVEATRNTSDLIKVVDKGNMLEDSLTSHGKESFSELIGSKDE